MSEEKNLDTNLEEKAISKMTQEESISEASIQEEVIQEKVTQAATSQENTSKDQPLSETWAQDALEDLEDWIEEQGIYIRQ